MKSHHEKWIVVVVVVVVITVTMINFTELTEKIIAAQKKFVYTPNPKWFPVKQTKTKNAFGPLELSCLDTLSLELAKELDTKIQCAGKGCKLLQNHALENIMGIKNINHLIFFVKAFKGHHIPKSQLQFLHKFKDGKIREATQVLYCFGNVDWKFDYGWVFKKYTVCDSNRVTNVLGSERPQRPSYNSKVSDLKKVTDCNNITRNKYYAPENNSIVSFTTEDTYELSELKDELRYFMIILIFDHCNGQQ